MADAKKDRKRLTEILKVTKFNTVVNLMANHQRNKWARAGYPGLQKKNPEGPAGFLSMGLMLERLAP